MEATIETTGETSQHPAHGSQDTASWLVLVAKNPRRAEYCMAQRNMEDEMNGRQRSFNTFVPYTYMESAIYQREKIEEKMSLRSALHRYIFVQGDEKGLRSLIRGWNSASDDKMFFLHDSSRKNAKISPSDMQKLMKACSDDEITFELPVTAQDIQPGKDFTLANTPFESKDTKYKVVSVKRKKGGVVQLQIELTLFNITFRKLFVTYTETTDDGRNASLVSSFQKKLLDILKRKVNNKETTVSKYEDEKTLRNIFEYRNMMMPDGAMKRHFIALMLICAQLMRDEKGKENLLQEAQKELSELSRQRESKAATDTRAYLHIALYMATKDPSYREQARAYVRNHDPKSPFLRQFITTSSKREARKFFGKLPKNLTETIPQS